MKHIVSFIALILIASSAYAGEVDFSKHILDLDGKDIPSSQAKDAPPLDLATVAGIALLTEAPADPRGGRPADSTDKLARFKLAVKVHGGSAVDLSSEEVTTLKTAVSAVYGPLVVGRAIEILDPPAKK
jgi:hypothetical protein